MKRFTFEFVVGIGYIAVWVGLAWAKVGELPTSSGVYPWWIPIAMLATVGIPFFLGYFAGKNSC